MRSSRLSSNNNRLCRKSKWFAYNEVMRVLDLLFPPRCVGCKRLGSYICVNCRKQLIIRQPLCPECDRQAVDGATHPGCLKKWGLDGLTTVFVNRGVIQKAIKTLKYRLVSDLAETLVELIPEKALLPQFKTREWAVCSIPLHKDRLKWRGFNQAEIMGTFLRQRLDARLANGLLIRHAKRTPQADISKREDRIKNAQGLFAVGTKTFPRRIILFDDVWTTGATMKEATKVLKRHGVEQVWGFTLAR